MALTILVTSSPSDLSSEQLLNQLVERAHHHDIIQIFFLGQGLAHTLDNKVINYLTHLKASHNIALGYCPTSAARHTPNYHSDVVEDYGLTQFYALIHDSQQLEQL